MGKEHERKKNWRREKKISKSFNLGT